MAIFFKLSSDEVECIENEAVRYSGCQNASGADENVVALVKKSCGLLKPVLMPQAVYEEFELKIERNKIKFADTEVESKDLERNLKGCKKIIVLAATIGAKVDMLIRRAQTSGSADAAVMQGSAAMFIESFVDKLNAELKHEYEKKGLKLHSRFSPGYGDVPLEFQKEIFRLLPCSKIGLSLMDTMIMAPEKSVTAFIGVE